MTKILIVFLSAFFLVSASAYAQEIDYGSVEVTGTNIPMEFTITSDDIHYTAEGSGLLMGPQQIDIGSITAAMFDNNYYPAENDILAQAELTGTIPDHYGAANTYVLQLGTVEDYTLGPGHSANYGSDYADGYSGGFLTLDGTTKNMLICTGAGDPGPEHGVVEVTNEEIPVYLAINDGKRLPPDLDETVTILFTVADY